MTFYSGDEFYGDDVTSGVVDDKPYVKYPELAATFEWRDYQVGVGQYAHCFVCDFEQDEKEAPEGEFDDWECPRCREHQEHLDVLQEHY